MTTHKNYQTNKVGCSLNCLDEAKESPMLFRHGCIATYGGKVIAKGCNTYKNYSSRDMFLDKCCSCHAEINVLRKIYNANKYKKRKLDRIMKKTTLYISRYSSNQSINRFRTMRCMFVYDKAV